MRKALVTGMATGVLLFLILIGALYVKQHLPYGNLPTDVIFLIILFGLIAGTLWFSMNYYCRSSAVRWGSLNFTGLTASFIAAMLVSVAGYLYTTYIHPGYLAEVMNASNDKWQSNGYSAAAIAGQLEWAWFDSPLDFALYNFQGIIIVLCITTLVIATVYYVRHRHRISDHNNADNHELIF